MNLAKLGCVQSIVVLFLISFIQSNSYAQAYNLYNQQSGRYYGEGFYENINSGKLKDDNLKIHLNYILKTTHLAQANGPDILGASCGKGKQNCYKHTSLGYSKAKVILMGQLHLVQFGKEYAIRCVYCEDYYGKSRFGGGRRSPAPGKVPNHEIMNTEHTWPQSRFSGRYATGKQRSDLHHLFPTDSRMNATRGNYEFGIVDQPRANTCGTFKVGRVAGQSGSYAEPPDSHKGNAARAIMYFSIRYDIKIKPYEEAVLKHWNRLDPVDQEEYSRAEQIFQYQGVRNPFIDHPELASYIADF